MSETVTVRQHLLGLQPYVLIQVTGGSLDEANEDVESLKLDIQFGGGLDEGSMRELVLTIAANFAEDGETDG
jgi:hypothetical protein